MFDTDIATVWDPSLLATSSNADLSHRKPASAETSRCNCCAQDNNKRNTLYVEAAKFVGAGCILLVRVLSVRVTLSLSSSVICQTTGPKPLPKRFLHIVRSRASSFNLQYSLLSLRSSSSFLRLLPRLLVTSICSFIFPSITCCRRQLLR